MSQPQPSDAPSDERTNKIRVMTVAFKSRRGMRPRKEKEEEEAEEEEIVEDQPQPVPERKRCAFSFHPRLHVLGMFLSRLPPVSVHFITGHVLSPSIFDSNPLRSRSGLNGSHELIIAVEEDGDVQLDRYFPEHVFIHDCIVDLRYNAILRRKYHLFWSTVGRPRVNDYAANKFPGVEFQGILLVCARWVPGRDNPGPDTCYRDIDDYLDELGLLALQG